MAGADDRRFREQLVLSLDDEGLEELILRVVRPEYPEAYRTGRGKDGGLDVISDHGNPPERIWQAKNLADMAWGSCRESLAAAMDVANPPPRYTFVFRRKLTKGEFKFWRETFRSECLEKYEALKTVDLWDDWADRLEERADIIDWLTQGALGTYSRQIAEATAQTGINPVAPATDETASSDGIGTTCATARPGTIAARIGKNDPHYRYGIAGREIEAAVGDESDPDSDIPDGRTRITVRTNKEHPLPTYTLAAREGDAIDELTAVGRQGVEGEQPLPSFSDSPEGRAELLRARSELAKGRSIVLDSSHARLHAGSPVPKGFREHVDEDGFLIAAGEIELGTSEPLELTIEIDLEEGDQPIVETMLLYKVPPHPGEEMSFGGNLAGAQVSINFTSGDQPDERFADIDLGMSVTGLNPLEALRGILFADAFGSADEIRFYCPGLLPDEGIVPPHDPIRLPEAQEKFEALVVVAQALARLNHLDGRGRVMPAALPKREIQLARMISVLCEDGGVRFPFDGERARLPVPPQSPDAAAGPQGSDPKAILPLNLDLGLLAENPTLVVEQSLEDAEPIDIEVENDRRFLVCRGTGPKAATVWTLVGLPQDPQGTEDARSVASDGSN